MQAIRQYHESAMECVELALIARLQGKYTEAATLFRRALEFEIMAVRQAEAEGRVQPTYAVLQYSAATLALDCNDLKKAERLITVALDHNPPPEIADELRELLRHIHAQDPEHPCQSIQ